MVGIVLSSLGITNYFLTFLGYLGTAIPPVAGIVIVDYFIIRKGEYHYGEGVKHHFCNVLALIAWIAGGGGWLYGALGHCCHQFHCNHGRGLSGALFNLQKQR